MVEQLIFIGVVGVILVIIYFRAKEPRKAIFSFALFLTPMQGGLWIKQMDRDIVMSTILLFLLALPLLFKDKTAPLKKKLYMPVFVIFLLTFAGATFSSIGAINRPGAIGGVFKIFENYLTFFVIYNIMKKPSDFKYIFFPLALSVAFQSILGGLQYQNPGFQIGVFDARRSFQIWRGHGTFFHPNTYGIYVLAMLPIVARLLLLSYRMNKKKQLYFYGVVFAMGIVGLISSLSRGSWLGFSTGMAVMFILSFLGNKDKMRHIFIKLIPVFSIIVILLSIKFGNTFISRLNGEDFTQSYEQRMDLQDQSKVLIRQYPIFGVGCLNYQEHINYEFVHNLFLLIQAETGIVGLSLFIMFLLVWIYHIWKGLRIKNIITVGLSYGIAATFIGFLISAIPAPDYFSDRQIGKCIWMLFGMTIALNRVSVKYNIRLAEKLIIKDEADRTRKQRLINHIKKEWSQIL